MSLTPGQCRAARGLIGWSQAQLSDASKVSPATLANFETGKRVPIANNLAAIRAALEAAGVVFLADGETTTTGGPGVRLRPATDEGIRPEDLNAANDD
ncbi:helix-turn-helix domain-containing protein [Rhizobiaceae sp. 2RAB30]